ncbi:hypothetical protein GJ496_004605 [Pomphorhynchus laevis]|nr:hypothetical protein GJ496_004605 [Pomphorhynchus laevis]
MEDYPTSGSSSPSYHVYPQSKSDMYNRRYRESNRKTLHNSEFYDTNFKEHNNVSSSVGMLDPAPFNSISSAGPPGMGCPPGSYYTGSSGAIQNQDFHNFTSTSGGRGGGGEGCYSYGGSFNDQSRFGCSSGVINGQIVHSSQESASNDMYGARRKGRFRRQAIRLPDAPPVTQQCRRRLPTPEADVLERVYIRRIPCKIIEEIIEEPMTPPPKVVERFINQPPRQNRYVRRVIKVPPRGGFPMYDKTNTNYSGGQGAFGAGYVPGHNMPACGGGSYGYMDSSTSAHASYSSMPNVPSVPSVDYATAPMSYSSGGFQQGIGTYGMQVGSNLQSSFGQMPMMSAYCEGPPILGGQGDGLAYDCYPVSPGYGGVDQYIGGGEAYDANNLGYYSGSPPNLICSVYPGQSQYYGTMPAPLSVQKPILPPQSMPVQMQVPIQAPMPVQMPPPLPAPIHVPQPMYIPQQPQIPIVQPPMQQFPSGGSYDFGYSGSSSYGDASAGIQSYGIPGYDQGFSGGYSNSLQNYGSTFPSTGSQVWSGGSQYQGGLSSGSGLQMYGSQCSSGFAPGIDCTYGSGQYMGSSSFGSGGQICGGQLGGYYPMTNQYQCGTGQMECGRVFRQVIALPEPPPEPIYNRQRLPTPPPDIYERILVCRPPRKIMYNIVEQPTCPPPVVRNQYVMGNAEPPSVMNQVMHVPPKSGGGVCPPPCQQPCRPPCPPTCPPTFSTPQGLGPVTCYPIDGSGLGMYGGCPSGSGIQCFPCDEFGGYGAGYPGFGGYPGAGGFPGGLPGYGGLPFYGVELLRREDKTLIVKKQTSCRINNIQLARNQQITLSATSKLLHTIN